MTTSCSIATTLILRKPFAKSPIMSKHDVVHKIMEVNKILHVDQRRVELQPQVMCRIFYEVWMCGI